MNEISIVGVDLAKRVCAGITYTMVGIVADDRSRI